MLLSVTAAAASSASAATRGTSATMESSRCSSPSGAIERRGLLSSTSSASIPRRRRRCCHQHRRLLVVSARASPPSDSNSDSSSNSKPDREFDVGRLWKEGGGVELTPEEAQVLREAAAKFSRNSVFPPATPPPLPPQPSTSPPPLSPQQQQKKQQQHSALRDRAQFDRLHASSVSAPSAFFGNLASGFEWRNAPALSHSKQALTRNGSSPTGKGFTPPPPWFVGGRLNVAVNCLDRHVAAGRGAQPAFIWPSGEGAGDDKKKSSSKSNNSTTTASLSYEDAASRVAELASWLSRSAGVGAGDSVALMLPPGAVKAIAAGGSSSSFSSSPLLALAFLAVARVGGAALLLDPSAPLEENGAALAASRARVAITCSGGELALHGGGGGSGGATGAGAAPPLLVPIKERLDAAADACFEEHGHALETVLCYEVEGAAVAETPWKCSRDVWSGAAIGGSGESSNTTSSNSSSAATTTTTTTTTTTSVITAWPDANAPLLLSIAPGTAGAVLLAYPGAGLLVCAGAASRLSLDASSEARVAVACSDFCSEAAVVFGVLGTLANGGSAVVLAPPRDAPSAGAWWALADKTKTTHVVADAACAAFLARSASSSGGAPPSVEVAMVVDTEPARPVVEALASSIGKGGGGGEEEEEEGKTERAQRPVVAAWMPAGAGCPVLAAAPIAAEASKPGGMLPWLGCAPFLVDGGEGDEKKKQTPAAAATVGRPALAAAWPSMARTALGPDAEGWLRDSVLCGPNGEFSPPAALFEVENDDGGEEWYWA